MLRRASAYVFILQTLQPEGQRAYNENRCEERKEEEQEMCVGQKNILSFIGLRLRRECFFFRSHCVDLFITTIHYIDFGRSNRFLVSHQQQRGIKDIAQLKRMM